MAGGHGEHDEEPLAELNCPMGQGLQSAAKGDPVATLYVPALHAVQAVLPLTFENVPAAHGAQSSEDVDALKGFLLPGLHSVHCPSPVEFPKEPAAHGRHAVFKLAPRRGL